MKNREKLTLKQSRNAFETWIADEPFGLPIERHPEDSAEAITWPGHYKSHAVQLAWEAWQEARR